MKCITSVATFLDQQQRNLIQTGMLRDSPVSAIQFDLSYNVNDRLCAHFHSTWLALVQLSENC